MASDRLSGSKPRTIPLSKRGFNFETFMWIFTRFSVVAMYGLIIAGFLGGLLVSAQTGANLADVLRWAFFPNAAENPFAGTPWLTILTRLMVTAFLLVVSAHGVHGVLEILDDYFASPAARRWSRNGIIAFFLFANAIGLYVIWTS
jgi:succinate dehydrogenase hydrophobic anchor subunit